MVARTRRRRKARLDDHRNSRIREAGSLPAIDRNSHINALALTRRCPPPLARVTLSVRRSGSALVQEAFIC
jgi:hypothetical protein